MSGLQTHEQLVPPARQGSAPQVSSGGASHAEDMPSDPMHSATEDIPSRAKVSPSLVKTYAVRKMQRDILVMTPKKLGPAALFGLTSHFEDATDRSREHQGAAQIREQHDPTNVTQVHRTRRNSEREQLQAVGNLRSDALHQTATGLLGNGTEAKARPRAPGIGRQERAKSGVRAESFDEEALLEELLLRIRCGVRTAQARQTSIAGKFAL